PATAAPRLLPAPAPGASSRWPPVALGGDRVPPPCEFGEDAAAILVARRRVDAQLAADRHHLVLDGLLCVARFGASLRLSAQAPRAGLPDAVQGVLAVSAALRHGGDALGHGDGSVHAHLLLHLRPDAALCAITLRELLEVVLDASAALPDPGGQPTAPGQVS